jgi:succinate dehydrogenase hydrophobic anchor subunit
MSTMAGSQSRRGRVVEDARADQPRPDRTERRRALAFVVIRLSGVLLAVLALGHFAMTHIVNDVAETDAQFIAERWRSALWITWDVTMLLAAFVHGVAGVWTAIADHTPDRNARRRRQRGVAALGVALVAVGLVVIIRMSGA